MEDDETGELMLNGANQLMDQIMGYVRACADSKRRRPPVKEADDALQFARVLKNHWRELHAFNVPLRRKQVYDDIIADLPDTSPFKAVMCKPNRRKKFVDGLIAKAKVSFTSFIS